MSGAAERLEADKALAAAVRDRILAVLDDLAAQETAKAHQCGLLHERRWQHAYAAGQLRQAKRLITEGDIK